MRTYSPATALISALISFAPGAAQAADPQISLTVTAIPTEVTLSRGSTATDKLQTLAAYEGTFSNGTTNALNRISFKATVTFLGTASTESIDVAATIPSAVSCTVTPTSTTPPTGELLCTDIGSLAAGLSKSVYIVLKAPTSGTAITLTNVRGGGEEGNGQGDGCCDTLATPSSTVTTALIDRTLTGSHRKNMLSFVTPGGGTFFTGDGAISSEIDPWTVKLQIKSFTDQVKTTARILERGKTPEEFPCAVFVSLAGCVVTELSIPGTFGGGADYVADPLDQFFPAGLLYTFLLDAKAYSLGRPENAKLKYYPDAGATYYYPNTIPPQQIAYPIVLGLCSADKATYVAAPSPGLPCLAEAPKKLSSKDTSDKTLWGDLRFLVRAVNNGRFDIQ